MIKFLKLRSICYIVFCKYQAIPNVQTEVIMTFWSIEIMLPCLLLQVSFMSEYKMEGFLQTEKRFSLFFCSKWFFEFWQLCILEFRRFMCWPYGEAGMIRQPLMPASALGRPLNFLNQLLAKIVSFEVFAQCTSCSWLILRHTQIMTYISKPLVCPFSPLGVELAWNEDLK